jgi:hypothetical protein
LPSTVGRRTALGLAAALLAGCERPSDPVAGLAADRAPIEISGAGFRTVELRFHVAEELPEFADDPSVFVHLLDASGAIARTFDHPLPGTWWPRETIADRFVLHFSALSAPPLPGEYRLTAGLYDPERGRYPLLTELPEVGKAEYEVARVTVRDASTLARRIALEGDWLPAEPDRDRQVVGARSLGESGPGAVVLPPFDAPGELFVRIALPEMDAEDRRLEIRDDAGEPVVRMTESCTGAVRELRGAGRRDALFDFPRARPDAGCRLELEPNYLVRPAAGGAPSSVRLQVVAWNDRADRGSAEP